MPSYKVVGKGFHGGKMYDPKGKRRELHTDKPFPSKGGKENVPSWLEAAEELTPQQVSARKAAATRAANAAQKKAEEDQKAITEASFLGEGEVANTSAVETL